MSLSVSTLIPNDFARTTYAIPNMPPGKPSLPPLANVPTHHLCSLFTRSEFRVKLGGRSGLLAPNERSTVSGAMKVAIRLALTGEILCEWDSSEVEELRVWELKQRFCQMTKSEEYFAWQLHDDRRLLKDHHFVANLANNEETELSLFAIKRRLRPPTLDERADILYYVSICHRRKLWRLVSQHRSESQPAPWLSWYRGVF